MTSFELPWLAAASKKEHLLNERVFLQSTGLGVADSSVRKIIARLRKGDLKETSSRQRSSDKRYQHIKEFMLALRSCGAHGRHIC